MRKWIAVTSIIAGLGVLGMAAGLAVASPGSQQYDTTTVTTSTGRDGDHRTRRPADLVATPNNSGTVKGASASKPVAPTVQSDSLPFTGASLIWIAGGRCGSRPHGTRVAPAWSSQQHRLAPTLESC